MPIIIEFWSRLIFWVLSQNLRKRCDSEEVLQAHAIMREVARNIDQVKKKLEEKSRVKEVENILDGWLGPGKGCMIEIIAPEIHTFLLKISKISRTISNVETIMKHFITNIYLHSCCLLLDLTVLGELKQEGILMENNKPRHVFLFQTMLIITKPKEDERLQFKQYICVSIKP